MSSLWKSSVVHKLLWPDKKLVYSQWPAQNVHGLSIYLGYSADVFLCVYQQSMDSGCCKILKLALTGGYFGGEFAHWITTYMTDRKFKYYIISEKKSWCKQLKIFDGHDGNVNDLLRSNVNDLLRSFINIYSQFSKDIVRIEESCINMGIIDCNYVSFNFVLFFVILSQIKLFFK